MTLYPFAILCSNTVCSSHVSETATYCVDCVLSYEQSHDISSEFFFSSMDTLPSQAKIKQGIKSDFVMFNPNPRCQGPKGLSCFEKQTAKKFLKLKKLKNLGIPGKLYVDYYPFYNN